MKTLASCFLAAGMLIGGSSLALAAEHAHDYGEMRNLVDRVQGDLRASSDLQHGNRQDHRYKNAEDHLSDFDRSLAKGHFDKDRLDQAIDDIKNLTDHNTLQASSRDTLVHDLEDLRVARERHGH